MQDRAPASLEFRILGPLEVWTEGRLAQLGGAKQRALLAILLLNANEMVSADRIVDGLWGEEPPTTAPNVLQVYVSQLRKVLGGGSRRGLDVLVTQRPGYVLRVGAAELDAARFASLSQEGHQALEGGEPAIASVKLREALALWRGPALADFAYESFAQRDIDRLDEQRLAALEDRFEADLELGRDSELVPELESVVEDNPLRERLCGHLMLAFYRAGRQAEALLVYQGTMRKLADDLGIDPTPSLQNLHEQILRQDVSLHVPEDVEIGASAVQAKSERAVVPVLGRDAAAPMDRTPGAGMPGTPMAIGEDQLLPVTALFADIVGSTSLAEKLKPNEVRVVIGDCISRMSGEVERFGGTIQAYMGDGICAYFGVPEPHEDDGQRAALAALQVLHVVREQGRQIEQAWGIPNFDVRIGVNAGRTLVGAVGAANPQMVAFGDPMNIAARLQDSADPGTIALGESVAKKLERSFSLEPLGQLTVKGRDLPVPAWRLLGRLDQPMAPPSTPLVGRTRELRRLEAALADLSIGRGQILLIRGDLGLGKSRIVAELRAVAEDRFRWLEGRCAPYADGTSLGPLPEIIRSWIGAASHDPELALRTKLRTRVDDLLLDDATELSVYLGRILGVPPDPSLGHIVFGSSWERMRSQTDAAVATWIRALSEEQPTALVVEDLHLADEQAVTFLEHVLPLTDLVPLLVVVSSRPEPGSSAWRLWLRCLEDFGHRVTELSLDPLPDGPAAELIDALAPTGTLEESARSEILARAAGNPLYIEELVKALVELGALERHGRGTLTMTSAGLELPPALESLLIARIQRLPPAVRRLAQAAAVIGREFEVALLEQVVAYEIQEDVTALLRAEIVREVRRHPDFVCRFAHSLLHEAALSTLTPGSIAQLAGTVMNALEASDAGTEGHLERLGAYAYRADDLPRALEYVERAAARALELNDDEAANRLLARAARLATKIGDPATIERIRRIRSDAKPSTRRPPT